MESKKTIQLLLFLILFSQLAVCIPAATFTSYPTGIKDFGMMAESDPPLSFVVIDTLSFGMKASPLNYSWSNWSSWWTMTVPFGKPDAFTATRLNSTSIRLDWINSANSTSTVIRGDKNSYPATELHGFSAYSGSGETVTLTSLDVGTLYCFRAWSYNATIGFSSDYADISNYTSPGTPYLIQSPYNTSTTIHIIWNPGVNSTQTIIRYNTTGFPLTPTSGLAGYAGVSDNTTIVGLNFTTTYYFSFWGYNTTSGNYSSRVLFIANTSFTPTPPTNFKVTSYNDTRLVLTWTKGTGLGTVYTYIRRRLGAYPTNATNGTLVYSGIASTVTDTGLTASTKYYYRAWSYSGSVYSDTNMSATNYTRPQTPINGSSTFNTTLLSVNLTWNRGNGNNNTLVIRNNASYPTSPIDGTVMQNSTANITNYYNESGATTSRYYTIFSYSNISGFYSREGLDIPWGALGINVYNESNHAQNITRWSIRVTNIDTGEFYSSNNNNNTLYLDVLTVPNGDDISITIWQTNQTEYYQHSYIIDLPENNFIQLNAYLEAIWINPGEPGGGSGGEPNETFSPELYYVRVIDELEAPIDKAKVTFQRAIGTAYENVSSLLTDANGYVNLYLIPNVEYRVVITKDGYNDEISLWHPDPLYYGIYYPKVFRLYKISVNEDIWNLVNWSYSPTVYDQYDNFTFYFNLSCASGVLEWCNMVVYIQNLTTAQWVYVYSYNETNSTLQANLSYTVSDYGKYGFECTFKLTNYSSYTFGTPHSSDKIVFVFWNLPVAGDIDAVISGVLGDNPIYVGVVVASWTALIAAIVSTFVLFTFSPQYSGLGVFAVGGAMVLLKYVVRIIPDSVLGWGVIAGIMMIGLLMLLYYRKVAKNPGG